MMTLWGIFKSPLMFGGNMPENDGWTLSLLTNEEYLKMHKDSFGAHQHSRNEKNGKGEIVWISNGKKCKYVALFNTKDRENTVKLDISEILMSDTYYDVFDIWGKEELSKVKNTLKAKVEPHGARLFIIK